MKMRNEKQFSSYLEIYGAFESNINYCDSFDTSTFDSVRKQKKISFIALEVDFLMIQSVLDEFDFCQLYKLRVVGQLDASMSINMTSICSLKSSYHSEGFKCLQVDSVEVQRMRHLPVRRCKRTYRAPPTRPADAFEANIKNLPFTATRDLKITGEVAPRYSKLSIFLKVTKKKLVEVDVVQHRRAENFVSAVLSKQVVKQ
ncbi:hypothetical protein DICVIV_01007 [Dictyocaulus viviparus]|uniref:Uncharacterized protein n=1 Tax=Dictyocaulus viviparus TaxID=29172 RepID=A0A0D8Y7W0_DICVI|nr:hypothetical protein DICVIV_01007 [Dictyocaulus viviparus]